LVSLVNKVNFLLAQYTCTRLKSNESIYEIFEIYEFVT
jgi:hypothetical protein